MPVWECLPAGLQGAQQATSLGRAGPSHHVSPPCVDSCVDASDCATCAQVLSCAQLFVTPRTVVLQAPLSVGCSRQEHWSGFEMSFSRRHFDQGSNPRLLRLLQWQLDSLPLCLSLVQNTSYMANIGFFFCAASALSESIWRKIGMDAELSDPSYAHNWTSL